MNSADIKEYLIDFQERDLPELVDRELKVNTTNKITSIIGPRRAGKTYFLYQKIKEYLKKGTKKENIIYLNFEDPRLIDINFKEIREIIKLHWELYPDSIKENLILFVDEPQNIENWEIAIRSLHDEGFKIFLTGSSSKLLSKEIATALRGRTLSYLLLPFSFREYLKMKDLKFDIERPSSKSKSALLGYLNEYLDFGGFPEIIKEDTENKIRTISEYFNLVVYRDIIERYKIKNTKLIKWLMRALLSSFSKEFSVHKYYLTLKSQGLKVSKNTLYTYLSMLEDIQFIFPVQKFDYSVRKRKLTISKVYLNDTGFAKLAEITRNIGRKIENIVFLELLRRKTPLTEIYYWKNQRQEEVDFVIKEGERIKELIQVTYVSGKDEVEQREIKALKKAGEELRCKNKTVITWDYEEEGDIRFIPLWRWLLEI